MPLALYIDPVSWRFHVIKGHIHWGLLQFNMLGHPIKSMPVCAVTISWRGIPTQITKCKQKQLVKVCFPSTEKDPEKNKLDVSLRKCLNVSIEIN